MYELTFTSYETCLCGAIGQRDRLLTERLVVRIHPGAVPSWLFVIGFHLQEWFLDRGV